MSNNIKTQIGNIIGNTLNSYHSKVKPIIDDLKFRQEYQDRIIECMVGEVDDNYIETPETNEPIVKLEHSKEGLVKVPSIKGKTILVDADGNETDTPAEGCRLVSVGEYEDNKLIILSKNKNLFDGELELGGLTNDDGSPYVSNNVIRCINYIPIKPNHQYVISNNLNYNFYIHYYDKNYNWIGYVTSQNKTSPSNAHYMKIRSAGGQIELNVKIQIEESNISTLYTEPKYYKTEILLDEPLRKIDNNIYDEIVGNKIIRRIGKIVLDGSENDWVDNTVNQSSILRFSRKISYNIITSTPKPIKAINNLIFSRYSEAHGEYSYIYCQGTVDENMNIYVQHNTFNDLNTFKKWLSENPITILYKLEEPIIEELPNGITLQSFDDTTMYIENSITPTVSYGYNALIPYKEELSLQKEEVETNTLDIENNIIPYLMDMEFNLMLMEDK